MNEEYLWDKSGEPDPEMQQLEQILGTLRYQPKPLSLPDEVRPPQRNHRVSLIAIAATLLVALLAAGLWLVATRKPEQELNAKVKSSATPAPEPTQPTASGKDTTAATVSAEKAHPERNTVAHNTRRSTHVPTPKLSKGERKEAIEAKQQLLVALKVASEKINLAHRKTQGPSPNQIRNQHKVG